MDCFRVLYLLGYFLCFVVALRCVACISSNLQGRHSALLLIARFPIHADIWRCRRSYQMKGNLGLVCNACMFHGGWSYNALHQLDRTDCRSVAPSIDAFFASCGMAYFIPSG